MPQGQMPQGAMPQGQMSGGQPRPGQFMPPPMMVPPRPRTWRERWMNRFGMNVAAVPLGRGELTIPDWLTGKAVAFFFVSMFAC